MNIVMPKKEFEALPKRNDVEFDYIKGHYYRGEEEDYIYYYRGDNYFDSFGVQLT
jgi:hypothetical protein